MLITFRRNTSDSCALELPGDATAQLRISVNGKELVKTPLSDQLEPFEIDIPKRMIGCFYGEEITLTLELVYSGHTEEAGAPGLWQLQNLTFSRTTRAAKR